METADHAYLILTRAEDAGERLTGVAERLRETRHRNRPFRVKTLGTVEQMMPATLIEAETHPSDLSLRVQSAFAVSMIEFPRGGFDDEGWSRHLLGVLDASDPQAVCHLVIFGEGR